MSDRPSIALASREIAPYGGGGIGTYWTAAAEALSDVADVTIFTTDHHRPAYERLRAAGDRRVSFAPVVFVAEPRAWEIGETDSNMSLWSARLFEALCAAYPDGGPDLVEFPDYLGEGFVTAQARRADDPRIARTTICVRGCTTAEMTSVLDGHVPDEFPDLLTHQIERYALAHCDHFVWAGGDVLGTYERFFGAEAIAAPARVRHPLFVDAAEPAGGDGEADLLRLLFVGRLERRKGVLDLARAISGIADERLRVTFLGGDTETAPLGQSMRSILELIVGDDPRVTLIEELPRERVPELVAAHDAVVLPSLWECWPAVALEALERDRPVLATPTGGFTEIVDEGSGWLTEGVGAEPLAAAIERLLAEPEAVAALRGSGRPRARFAELSDLEEVRSGYLALAAERPPAPEPLAERPLVSVVIPYFRLEEFVEEAVRSVEAQTYPEIEIVIVNDGSLRPADSILEPLAERYGATVITQVNAGLGAARNTGIVHARGRYVMFLDADNVLGPRFIERCVEVLERRPEFAYATAWARYIDERGEGWRGSQHEYRALGNWTPLVHRRNVAGDAAAVFRRDLFTVGGLAYGQELTSFEDWALYRLMHDLGLVGTVVPERLLEYRIRDKSMLRQIGAPNQDRIEGEIRAWIEEMRMQWTPPRT